MEKVICAVVDLLTDKQIIKDKDREIYIYGLKSIAYDMLLTIILILIGIVMKMVKEASVIIVSFYILQTNGGGFHAKNHALCISSMSFGMIISLLNININPPCQYVLFVIALLILFCIPLVIHPKKQYLFHKSRKFIEKSYFLTMIIVLILIILLKTELISFACVTSALFFPAISRLTGRMAYKNYDKNNKCCSL